MSLGFFFDSTRCIGCRTCQIACKDRNNLGVGELIRCVASYESGSYPAPSVYHYSGACNHCANPACVANCPTGATFVEEDGTVGHNPSECIGCKACVNACPYSHPVFLPEQGIIGRCDSCKPFRDSGRNPVCVDSCLTRALEFGALDELKSLHGEDLVNQLPFLPSADITTPSVLIKAADSAKSETFNQVSI